MNTFKHLLVPTDFSDPSECALELALDLAIQQKAQLTLVHFWEIPPYPYVLASCSPPDLMTAIQEAANQQLAETLARVQVRLPSAKAVCRMGSPWQEIVGAIRDLHADLVVMGTHGRRGVRHALLGSVAEKVVRLSPVPVLTVPARLPLEPAPVTTSALSR